MRSLFPVKKTQTNIAEKQLTEQPSIQKQEAVEAVTIEASKGDQESYRQTIIAWLDAHKRYPRRALARRLEGTVTLHLVVEKTGALQSYRLQHSSNHGILDKEADAMVKRANPFPAAPASFKQKTIAVTVPVDFYLR